MYSCLVSTLLLPLFSAALPTTDGKPSTSWTPNQQQVVSFSGNSAVKFDNVGAGVGLGLPVRALQSLGAYSLLSYNNLAVVNPMNDLAGLKPFSKPNVLGYDVVFALQGQQTITAKYDDSITDACTCCTPLLHAQHDPGREKKGGRRFTSMNSEAVSFLSLTSYG